MPVRNALPYLDAAIESILGQTFTDFEFVIRDDDSSDGSTERLRYWAAKDSRIRLFESDQCLGPAGSSNWVVRQATAPIVARMDADDIAVPTRFEKQLQVFRDDPDAVLVGSAWQGIDRQGRVVREADITTFSKSGFAAPFAHGSIMFRRDAFEQTGGYRAECDFWEDLDLYGRMTKIGRVLFVTEPLYLHRFSETSTRLTSPRRRVEDAVDLMFRCRAAHERGEDYEHLLRGEARKRGAAKHNPNTFLSLGFITLWSGLRPPTLQRLLSDAELRFDMVTVKALGWALWASVSPQSLRAVMRRRLVSKLQKARKELGPRTVIEWRPRAGGGAQRTPA